MGNCFHKSKTEWINFILKAKTSMNSEIMNIVAMEYHHWKRSDARKKIHLGLKDIYIMTYGYTEGFGQIL